MRVLVVAACLLACACAEVSVFRDYHEQVGIPLAAKIKEQEERMRIGASRNVQPNRIIGGVQAPVNGHPHFGGLLIDLLNGRRSVCGSSLLSATRLVTAAHCWAHGANRGWQLTVVLGTTQLYDWNALNVVTQQVVMHPQYNMQNLQNDIAMIYLPFPIAFSVRIQPVALPSGVDASQSFVNYWANAVGFGATADNAPASIILHHVNLRVISFEQCRAEYGAAWIFHSTLCTSGTGSVGVCGGDSGGPLTTQRNGRNVLIGVASFAADKQCEQGYPSGFARVTSFLSFIHNHL